MDENMTLSSHIRENKIRITKAIILPTITYRSEIWSISKATEKQKLQAEINIVIRWIVNASCYVTNKQLRKDLKFETLKEIIQKRKEDLITKMKYHSSRLIEEAKNKHSRRNNPHI